MGRKWRWELFQGSRYMLGLMKRDIHYVDEAVTYCRGRQACVQAGGNLGIYPKRLASYFRTVYTFEPASDLWPMLLHNAPESNIVKMQAALGDERRLIKVSRERRDGKPNAHEGIGYTVPNGTIPTLRVDDLICRPAIFSIWTSKAASCRRCADRWRRCFDAGLSWSARSIRVSVLSA